MNPQAILFREAQLLDIDQMHIVRNSVRENALSNPNLITHDDYVDFLFARGKGWVCEVDQNIVGFAVVDILENNIWALFLKPEYEGKGIGRTLHDTMLNWYFQKTTAPVWLGTAPNTRAEGFYRKAGWTPTGMHGKNEIKFEMSFENWINSRPQTL
ncbi:MAG: GNAT family N-acetyltransferase [Saprospiraceae bacterium]|nr:GNAT family N-acetyltransferase [Saprospiraceae bacterium]